MEILNLNRGAGKTTALIKESNRKQIPIVVKSKAHKIYLIQQATDMEVKIPAPITINELIRNGGFSTPTEVLVDEFIPIFEEMFASYFKGCIVKATCTIEDFTKNN